MASRFLFLLFSSLVLVSGPSFSHDGVTSYFCRGTEIFLKVDPRGAVVEFDMAATKSAEAIESILDPSVEVLYSDPNRGRHVYRNPNGALFSELKSKSLAGVRVFPLFTTLDGESEAIAFDEISVRLSSGAPTNWIDEVCDEFDLEVVSRSVYEPDVLLLRPTQNTGLNGFELASEVREKPHFDWVIPNLYTARLTGPAPNDPYFVNQIHHSIIDTLGAWDTTMGNTTIRVAIIDGGVDLQHEDLSPNVWINPGEISGLLGVDDDGNGFVDDFNGWDFYSNDNVPTPAEGGGIDAGHGSAVTGLIVAEQNNSVGVSGVAPGVKFIACKGFNNGGSGGNSVLAEAIRYAANMADIMNNSWASDADLPSEAILDAIDYAMTQGRGGLGCLPIWAAGNGEGDETAHYGSYPWTVGVSLLENSGIHDDLTSFDETVQISAPVGQWSTDASGPIGFNNPEPDYVGVFDGSSSAAPIVTGVGALILSRSPGLTATEVAVTLLNSTDNPVPGISDNDFYGKSPTLGYGRVNAHRAVSLGTDSINDRLEPNDSTLDAAELKSGYYTWLYLPEGDVDYYRLRAEPNARMKFSLEWLSDWGPMDIQVLDSDERVVATSTLMLQDHVSRSEIDWVAPIAGDYFLKAYSSSGPGKAYALRATVGRSDDPYEPNDSLQQSAFLNPGTGTSIEGLVLNDEDYFRVSMTNGQYLYGLVTFNQANVNIGIEVYNPSGQPILNTNTITYGDQFQPVQATEDGDYGVRVYAEYGNPGREYSLHLAVLNAAPLTAVGSDDSFEDNDTFPTATLLGEGFYPNLALDDQGGEVFDAFTFTVPAGKVARITMGWGNAGTDIDILTYPDEVISLPPGSVPPIGKSSRKGVAVESITLPSLPMSAVYYTEIVRAAGGHQPYRLALEFLDPDPCEIVSLWRFNEGNIGSICDSVTIRDWRGPRLSHSPQLVGNAPNWMAGPDPVFFPGSDGIALNFNSGGFRFPGNGDMSELALGDRDFCVWSRILPKVNNAKRVIAGQSGSWQFSIRSDDTLEMNVGAGSGNPVFNGSGPSITPGIWQDVALVWDRTAGQVRLFTSSGVNSDQTSTPIPGPLPIVGDLYLASSSVGTETLGGMEQIRLFDQALSTDEIRRFSVGFIPSNNDQWKLYE